MDKREVIKTARKYVAYCRNIPDKIAELNQQIVDNERQMTFVTINVSSVEIRGNTPANSSPVYGVLAKKERLIKENKTIAAKIEKMEREYEDFRHFLRWHLYNGTGWNSMNVLYDRYYKGLSLTALCNNYRRSKQTVGKQENKELLTLANVVLELKADGEFYDSNGTYKDYTEKTKQQIRDWVKRLNNDPVVSMAY